MRTLTAILLLLGCLALTSFQQEDKGAFSATVDGKLFQLSENQLFRGLVTNKAGSMDGRQPAKTVITTTFNGPSYNATEGRLFNENVVVEINYAADKTGESAGYTITMQYQSGNYYNIKEQSKLNVTRFEWESDRKHFRISADLNCKLRSWGAPADGKKDISLKGKMTDIRVTVPSWVTAKN